MTTHYLRLPAVKSISGYSGSTILLRVAHGLWTRPVKIDKRRFGWPVDEVEKLLVAHKARKPDAVIRSLVLRLEAARMTAPPKFIGMLWDIES